MRSEQSYEGELQRRGQIAESMVKSSFEAKGFTVEDKRLDPVAQQQAYDFVVSNDWLTFKVEVKSDRDAKPGGQLFAEQHRIWHNKQPYNANQVGWWWRTKADWLVYVHPEEKVAYRVRPNAARTRLQDYVMRAGRMAQTKIVESDDEKTTFGILLPFNCVEDVIERIDL